MREGREERLEITRAAHRGAGKDLDVVGAGAMGGDDLSGRERAGNGELAGGLGGGDHFRMQAGADDELGAGLDGLFGFFGGGHGAGAEQELRIVLLQFAQQVDRAGDGHGDFDDGDAAGDHGFDDGVGLLCDSWRAERG